MLRSTWIASELLTTFTNESKLASVTMLPQSPPLSEGGIFRVCASSVVAEESNGDKMVLWDRKVQGRFPESKEVKQLVRDCVSPDKDLGHSDNKQTSSSSEDNNDTAVNAKEVDCVECKEQQQDQQSSTMEELIDKQPNSSNIPSIFYEHNHVSIEYSTGSSIDSPDNGLYRATYYANELLSMVYDRNSWWKKKQQKDDAMVDDGMQYTTSTTPTAVDSVTLIPNRLDSGILRVKLNDHKILYEQSTTSTTIMDGYHLRDIAKKAILNGDSDEDSGDVNADGDGPDDIFMDDDEAEEARNFFGVL